MSIRRRLTAALVAIVSIAGLTAATATPAAAATVRVRATFASPKTDGLSKVAGQVTVRQATGGPIVITGKVSGLPAWSAFVVVPYIGGGCLPVPGVTAFPSTPFITDATGAARISTTVNPKAINPVGSFAAAQTGSVSIRGVLFPARSIPIATGTTLGTPTLPNVAAVEACDSAPRRIA